METKESETKHAISNKSKTQNSCLNVVIPVYGNKEPINEVLDQIPIKELENHVSEINFLIVYTPKEKDEKLELGFTKTKFTNLSILEENRRGYGQAYQTGFSNVNEGIIVTFDADGTYPVELLPNLVQEIMGDGVEFISVNRLENFEEKAFSKRNLIGNKILTKMANVLFNAKMKDSQSGMWVFKSELLKKMDLKCTGMEFSTDIKLEALKHNSHFKELPGIYRERILGSEPALCPWKDGMRIVKFLFRKRLLSGFNRKRVLKEKRGKNA